MRPLTILNSPPLGVCRAEGMVKNFNTVEEFKKADKNKMLQNAAKAVCRPGTETDAQGLG